MPSGFVNRSIGAAANRVPGVRRLPVFKLVSAAEIALLAREHLGRLEPEERRRMFQLVRAGRGRTSQLTDSERDELGRLVAKLEPRLLAGRAADRLSPLPLPRRVVHGPRKRKRR
jgi:hypothetical protein